MLSCTSDIEKLFLFGYMKVGHAYRAKTTFPHKVGLTSAAGNFVRLLSNQLSEALFEKIKLGAHTKRLKLTQLG
jgi:hypothetical protein